MRLRDASISIIVCLLFLFVFIGNAQTNSPVPIPANPPPPQTRGIQTNQTPVAGVVEETRQACLQGRRQICGRVVQISAAGLVIDSGYTALLRAPLNKSWLVPGTADAGKNLKGIELDEPGSPCFGFVLLATFPKSPPVKLYDYVVIQGYPAGSFEYSPVDGVRKTIRKFAAGLDTAVQIRLANPEKATGNR